MWHYIVETYRISKDGLCRRLAQAVNVLQGNLDALAVRNLYVVDTQVLDAQRGATNDRRLSKEQHIDTMSAKPLAKYATQPPGTEYGMGW